MYDVFAPLAKLGTETSYHSVVDSSVLFRRLSSAGGGGGRGGEGGRGGGTGGDEEEVETDPVSEPFFD